MNNSSNQNKKSSSTRGKTIFLVILSIVFIGLAILIWANQTGRISLFADTTKPEPFNIVNITTKDDVTSTVKTQDTIVLSNYKVCASGAQFYVYVWDETSSNNLKLIGPYPVTNNPIVVNHLTKQNQPRFYVIKCQGGINPIKIAAAGETKISGPGGGTTPTTSGTPTTPGTTCQTSSTDPGVCTQAFSLTLTPNCSVSTNNLTWNLGSNPSSKYSQITVQRRDETTGGSFTLGDPQINQSAITSSWPCNSSGQCSHTDKVDKTHKYTYRVYVKNKSDNKWYRSYEAYANPCGGVTPTSTPTITPTSTSMSLNSVTSECSGTGTATVGRQKNTLNFTPVPDFSYYSPMVKSTGTDGKWVYDNLIMWNTSMSSMELFHYGYDDVDYKIVATKILSAASNENIESNVLRAPVKKECPLAPAPSSQPTPTSSSDVTLNKVTCKTKANGKQDLVFDFSTTVNESLDITAALESVYTNGPTSVIGQKYWQTLWGSNITGSQTTGNISTKSFTLSDVDPSWMNKTYPENWRVMLWPSNNPDAISYSNNFTVASCDGSTPTVSPTPTPTVSPTTIVAPTNVYATVQSATEMKLSWDPSITEGVVYYNIYNASTNSLIKSVTSSINEISITGLKCGTEYKYYVTAGIESTESVPSNTAVATTSTCSTGDDISDKKPENISLDYLGGGLATLSWDGVEGATGYDIYNCNGEYLVSTSQNSYGFTGNNCGQILCYYVIAHNDSSESQKSDQASVDTESCGGDTPSTPSVTSLISTGASLWFNILIALLLIFGIGYFLFRNKIHGE